MMSTGGGRPPAYWPGRRCRGGHWPNRTPGGSVTKATRKTDDKRASIVTALNSTARVIVVQEALSYADR